MTTTIRNLFPERQIFVRVDGRVSYLTLTTRTQFVSALALAAVLGWSVAATVGMQHRAGTIERQAGEIAELVRDRTRLGGELAATRAQWSNAATEIARQYDELRRLVAMRGTLEQDLASTQSRLAVVEANYSHARDRATDLDGELALIRDRLDERTRQNDLISRQLSETAAALAGAEESRAMETLARAEAEERASSLESILALNSDQTSDIKRELEARRRESAMLAEARDLAEAEARRLGNHVESLRHDLTQQNLANATLRRRLAATADALTETHASQVDAEQRGYRLADTVASLEARLQEVRETQITLLQEIGSRARRNIDTLKRTLDLTGLSLEDMLDGVYAENPGMGGPLVAEDGSTPDPDSFERVVGDLEVDMARWEAMQVLLERIPLARPTMSGYISSQFGRRKDPFTGKTAFHKGIDIAAPPRTPVHATAPGIVTVAGWDGAYGRMVEVDHGSGFKTRYGHLRTVTVKKGERVTFHQQVGTMGSSGRSTGSHVHYEVEYNNKQIDPERFLKAGRYVFKVEDDHG
ncbi:MAG: peptidoglycan DD-metalloendopeptidase family protein [Pseudomonadota bacterium]|nr:peptidoglycan DD-metalloendopeptidase family protein [Pseudomonadota bacterium]